MTFICVYKKRRGQMKCKRCKNEAIEKKSICEKCSIRQKENFRKYREKKKSNGLCVQCPKNTLENHTLCETCLMRQKEISKNKKKEKKCLDCTEPTNNSYCENCTIIRNERRKKYRKEKKAQKICVDCSNFAKLGFQKCKDCLNKVNDKKQKSISENLCVICKKEPPEIGKLRCVNCNLYDVNRRLYFKENNLCLYCGKQKNDHMKYCDLCYLKRTSKSHFGKTSNWPLLKNLFEKQNGKCPYTGEKLILGKNTELDHKVPKSKGGENKIENFQWTLTEINRMKEANYENIFLELVKKIYEFKQLETYAT